MIIIPNLFKDNLTLKAYSAKNTELQIVNDFLTERDFKFVKTIIESDSYGRKGQRFLISGDNQIRKFEIVLRIRFKVPEGFEYDDRFENNPFNNRQEESNIDIEFENNENENSYCCKRINDRPAKKESQEITAVDYYAAVLKCCILAKSKNWYAADTEKGKCLY